MNILTKATVLVLNRNWQAINVRTPQEAFCMMATNVATALEIEYETPAVSQSDQLSTLSNESFGRRCRKVRSANTRGVR